MPSSTPRVERSSTCRLGSIAGRCGASWPLAERAHAVLGCDAYSRVDFRVDGARPYLIELNTLPA